MTNLPYEDYFPKDRDERHFQRYKKFMLSLIKRGHLPHDKENLGSIEYHHILPKSMWNYDLGNNKVRDQIYVSNDESFNVVGVTAHEHFVLHLMLYKSFSRSYMSLAIKRMAESEQNGKIVWLTGRQYQNIKENAAKVHSFNMKGRITVYHPDDEKTFRRITLDQLDDYISRGYSEGMNPEYKNPRIDFSHSDKTRKHLSDIQKTKVGKDSPRYGKPTPESGLKKQREAKLGKIQGHIIHKDGEIESHWYETEEDFPEGFERGKGPIYSMKLTEEERKNKWSYRVGTRDCEETRRKKTEAKTGCKWMTDGFVNHFAQPKDFEKYKSKGFRFGYTPSEKQKEANLKLTKKQMGSKFMNNGEKQKRVPKDEIETYLSNGWNFGKLKKKEV